MNSMKRSEPANGATPHERDGVDLLEEYLAERHMSQTAFANIHRLDRVQLHRVMSRKRRRISVDFAASIEDATGGAVLAVAFRTAPVKSEPPGPSVVNARPRRAAGEG
jgi:hypothetical protein